MFIDDLRRATLNLDSDVTRWLARALDCDWRSIAPGAYEHEGPENAVCPIAAAAIMAGIWWDGRVLPGNPAWGTAGGPASEVEDFAAYFDLCAEESGTAQAIETVRRALSCPPQAQRFAA